MQKLSVYEKRQPDSLQNISNPYEQIEKTIDESRYEEAIRLLDSMDSHTAYWNYHYGFTLAQKGMVNDASHYLPQAVSMEPNDNDYQDFLNQINSVIEEQRQEEDRKKGKLLLGQQVLHVYVLHVCVMPVRMAAKYSFEIKN